MGKTYFIDVDGTIAKYLTYEQLDMLARDLNNSLDVKEILLPGVKELWKTFKPDDKIIITTARYERHRAITAKLLNDNGLRYDMLLMDLPNGPRVLINDVPSKNSKVKKAIAINVERNKGFI